LGHWLWRWLCRRGSRARNRPLRARDGGFAFIIGFRFNASWLNRCGKMSDPGTRHSQREHVRPALAVWQSCSCWHTTRAGGWARHDDPVGAVVWPDTPDDPRVAAPWRGSGPARFGVHRVAPPDDNIRWRFNGPDVGWRLATPRHAGGGSLRPHVQGARSARRSCDAVCVHSPGRSSTLPRGTVVSPASVTKFCVARTWVNDRPAKDGAFAARLRRPLRPLETIGSRDSLRAKPTQRRPLNDTGLCGHRGRKAKRGQPPEPSCCYPPRAEAPLN